jgi:hypothetical protein
MRQQMLKNGRISGESQVYFLLREKKTRDSSTTQGKTVMKMTSEAFCTWSQHLRLSSETEALIITIRSSPPVRRVSGHAQPARYQHAETGQWHCPPGETYAEQLGLTYRLRSSAEFHPLEIQNLKFL